jgi:ABC-type lipoprotein export system ATPase subunit
MAGESVVRLDRISKTYFGGVPTPVLFDLEMAVKPGEFVGVVGASGSGKTTLLNILGLLDVPTGGRYFLGDTDVTSLDKEAQADMRRDKLGFIFQFHYLLPEFTVLENALMPCRLRSRTAVEENRDRIAALLTEVGLGERLGHRPAQLSGGQQQRVAVVRALANDPAVVLADEPTGNLDSKSGAVVFDLMQRLCRETGKAFLMVTHDKGFAARCDRVMNLVDGRFAA